MSVLKGLRPWQYQVSDGYTARGFYTEPTGKPVLHFVHGNGFCGLSYEVLLSHLQDDVDLFISDAQGHGDSGSGDGFVGWNRSSRNIEEVWSHFSDMYRSVPKIASGHSYGGVMTTLMMARNSDLFDAALLLDPTYAPPMMATTMSALSSVGLMKKTFLAKQALVRTIRWDNAESLWEYFHQRGVFKGWQDDCLRSYLDHAMNAQEDGSYELKCPPEIESAIFASYPKRLWPAISRIRKPVTMFYGERTFPFILKSRIKVRKSNPYFDFMALPGGHCFMQENPKDTAHEMARKIRMLLN